MSIEYSGTGELVAYVLRHMTCPYCGASYESDNVRVAQRHEVEWTLAATCVFCHAEHTIAAYDSPPYAQLQAASPTPPSVVTKEVVDGWATFLAAFSGDVYDLFANLE